MNVILLGAPGSGKGTQASRLQAALGLAHVASGDLFRYNLNNETELGMIAKSYMDRGELVPDDLTVKMVLKRMAQPDVLGGLLLDGFPRTVPQAEALDSALTDIGQQVDGVIHLYVDPDVLVERVGGRVICRKCQRPFHSINNPFITCPTNECHGEYLYHREDDHPDTVRKRIETYNAQTAPLVERYRARGLLVSISGDQEIDQVTEAMLTAANKFGG